MRVGAGKTTPSGNSQASVGAAHRQARHRSRETAGQRTHSPGRYSRSSTTCASCAASRSRCRRSVPSSTPLLRQVGTPGERDLGDAVPPRGRLCSPQRHSVPKPRGPGRAGETRKGSAETEELNRARPTDGLPPYCLKTPGSPDFSSSAAGASAAFPTIAFSLAAL